MKLSKKERRENQAAAALLNSRMITEMSDYDITMWYYDAKKNGDGVMCTVLVAELSVRGERIDAARRYFKSFRNHCTTEQLERIAARYAHHGHLSVLAESEIIAREFQVVKNEIK
jgi:hypothetical protein